MISYTLTLLRHLIHYYVYYSVGKQYLYSDIQQLLCTSFIAVYFTIQPFKKQRNKLLVSQPSVTMRQSTA